MAGLICDKTRSGLLTLIQLTGSIDEDAGIADLETEGGPIEFNFRGVIAINSLGIRAWVKLMKSLERRSVSFAECPAVVIRQINMVPMFIGKATISSLLAPYFCDECDNEESVLVHAEDFDSPLNATRPCDRCGKQMELEVPAERLFSFHKRSPHA